MSVCSHVATAAWQSSSVLAAVPAAVKAARLILGV